MGKRREYTLDYVLNKVKRNPDITIDGYGTIVVKANATRVGNKTHGKIDYLCKMHGYHVHYEKPKDYSDVPSKKKKHAVHHTPSRVEGFIHSNRDLLNLATPASKGKPNAEYFSEHYFLVEAMRLQEKFRPNFDVKVDKVMIVNKKEADRIFAENH